VRELFASIPERDAAISLASGKVLRIEHVGQQVGELQAYATVQDAGGDPPELDDAPYIGVKYVREVGLLVLDDVGYRIAAEDPTRPSLQQEIGRDDFAGSGIPDVPGGPISLKTLLGVAGAKAAGVEFGALRTIRMRICDPRDYLILMGQLRLLHGGRPPRGEIVHDELVHEAVGATSASEELATVAILLGHRVTGVTVRSRGPSSGEIDLTRRDLMAIIRQYWGDGATYKTLSKGDQELVDLEIELRLSGVSMSKRTGM
jgi:hypothetical protein